MKDFRMKHQRIYLMLGIAALFLLAMPLTLHGQEPQPATDSIILGASIPTSPDVGPNPEVFRVNVDGSGFQNLTNNPSIDDCPVLSPDGTQIAFQSRRDLAQKIYIMDVNGQNLRSFDQPVSGLITCPAFSPDGTRIVYGVNGDGNRDSMVLVNVGDGSQLTLTSNLTIADETGIQFLYPTFLPDGSRIAFISNYEDGFVTQIYSIDITGNGVQKIGNASGPLTLAAAPNGQLVFETSNLDGTLSFTIMNGTTGAETTTINGKYPVFSPDGNWLAYVAYGTGEVTLLNLTNSNTSVLPNTSGSTPLAFSPDSAQLFFASATNALQIINIDGTNERTLPVTEPFIRIDYADWASSGTNTAAGSTAATSAPVVTIGEQTWYAENLSSTTCVDGTPIPYVSDPNEWLNQTGPAYTWSSNVGEDPQARQVYGALYNSYAVQQPCLCPQGWRIPTQQDFQTLLNTLNPDAHLKLRDPNFWADGNGGVVASGFNARPGGGQGGDVAGSYTFGEQAYLWSSGVNDQTAILLWIKPDAADVVVAGLRYGFSARCIQE